MRRLWEGDPSARAHGAPVSTSISDLAKRISDLEKLVAAGAQRGEPDETETATRDSVWRCVKCSRLLAFYDVSDDVLRIKHREHVIYTQLGAGGWIQVVCPGCGQPNRQDYVPVPGDAAPEAVVSAGEPIP